MISAVLLDFDGTIVTASAKLKAMRETARANPHKRAAYNRMLYRQAPCRLLTGETSIEAIRRLQQQGIPVAVVSHYSSPIITAWLSKHLAVVPPVVASQESAKHGLKPKPAPDRLLHALKILGVAASPSVLHVGDGPTDHEAARLAGVQDATWSPKSLELSLLPSVFIAGSGGLTSTAKWYHLSTLVDPGEEASQRYVVDVDRASLPAPGLRLLDHLIVIGQYYGRGDTPGRSEAARAFSAELLQWKEGESGSASPIICGHFVRAARRLKAMYGESSWITCSIPLRGAENPRFPTVLDAISGETGYEGSDLIKFVSRDVRRQQGLNAEARVANREHTMVAEDVLGKNVMVIDDVITTGATLAEAVRALMEAGAARVAAIVLGKTAYPPLRGTPPIAAGFGSVVPVHGTVGRQELIGRTAELYYGLAKQARDTESRRRSIADLLLDTVREHYGDERRLEPSPGVRVVVMGRSTDTWDVKVVEKAVGRKIADGARAHRIELECDSEEDALRCKAILDELQSAGKVRNVEYERGDVNVERVLQIIKESSMAEPEREALLGKVMLAHATKFVRAFPRVFLRSEEG